MRCHSKIYRTPNLGRERFLGVAARDGGWPAKGRGGRQLAMTWSWDAIHRYGSRLPAAVFRIEQHRHFVVNGNGHVRRNGVVQHSEDAVPGDDFESDRRGRARHLRAGQPVLSRRSGHTSVSVVLDRYGHLFEGTRPPCWIVSMRPSRGRSCHLMPMHPRVFRGFFTVRGRMRPALPTTPSSLTCNAIGGRGGTRTPDICLVRAAL
jgi:hypothetical protein